MKDIQNLLVDMVNAIETIESYSVTSYEQFLEDSKTQDAVMYNLIVLGEAAHQLPESYREANPQIPWPSIIGTRNVVVHGYDQVKIQIVWDIIQKNLNILKTNLIQLKD